MLASRKLIAFIRAFAKLCRERRKIRGETRRDRGSEPEFPGSAISPNSTTDMEKSPRGVSPSRERMERRRRFCRRFNRYDKCHEPRAVSFRGDNATIPLKFAATATTETEAAATNDNDVGGIAGHRAPSAPTKSTRKFRPCRVRDGDFNRRRCRRRDYMRNPYLVVNGFL